MKQIEWMRRRGAELWSKWEELVSEQTRSGQSVAAFCRERGLTVSQVFAWKKRLRERAIGDFVEAKVVLSEEQSKAQGAGNMVIEVRLDRGRSLVVEPGFDASHLRAILSVLEAES